MTTRYVALFALCTIYAPLAAGQLAAGRVECCSGAPAEIMSYDPNGAFSVRTIDVEGTVTFDLPEAVDTSQTVVQTFRCSAGPLSIEGGDTMISPTTLFVARDGDELGDLIGVSSEAVASWCLSFGQGSAEEGFRLQWTYAAAPARVEGTCEAEIYLDSAGENYAEQTLKYDLAFRPGWNLMRYGINETVTAPGGRRHPSRIKREVVAAVPKGTI